MTPPVFLNQTSIVATAAPGLSIAPVVTIAPDHADHASKYIIPIGGRVEIPKSMLPANVTYTYRTTGVTDPAPERFQCGADLDGDGNCGTDADIEFFFAAIATCDDGLPSCADFDDDGTPGTSADITAFFAVLGGG